MRYSGYACQQIGAEEVGRSWRSQAGLVSESQVELEGSGRLGRRWSSKPWMWVMVVGEAVKSSGEVGQARRNYKYSINWWQRNSGSRHWHKSYTTVAVTRDP
jgi:hypothetical protein